MAETKVTTNKVRFSYVNVFVPTAMEEGQDKKYNIAILIPKSDKVTVKKIKDAIETAKQSGIESKWNGALPKKLNLPLHDGDEDKDDEAYAGHYYINAKSKNKPKIVDREFEEILDPEDFYSGCYGRACVDFYAYNAGGGKGVAVGIRSLMKLADGEPLGGAASNPREDFGDDFEDEDLL